jgi:hypothetical protein
MQYKAIKSTDSRVLYQYLANRSTVQFKNIVFSKNCALYSRLKFELHVVDWFLETNIGQPSGILPAQHIPTT